MYSSNAKVTTGIEPTPAVARINGRPVLQPTCNRVPTIDIRPNFVKKHSSPKTSLPSPLPSPPSFGNKPTSPKSKSPRPPAIKRASTDANTNTNALSNSSSGKQVATTSRSVAKAPCLDRKKSKSFKEGSSSNSSVGIGNGSGGILASLTCSIEASLRYSSSLIVEAPWSIAADRREQMALHHAQRKMRIAHYGRSKSAKFDSFHSSTQGASTDHQDLDHQEIKRCSFITQNSDPMYVAYHDEEWGVPVHDNKMLFELLVLSGAQVGSDWSSILKKRQDFRDAFFGFDAEIVANITEKQVMSICTEYGFDITRVRSVVDNANRILQIKEEFGSFEKYIWGFVNNKAISTGYKFGHKIPVKTSKSESISKDMVRRGFRLVGPTMVHSFMQAAGLTNDHLIFCFRHLPCTLLSAPGRPISITQQQTSLLSQ